MLSVVVRPTRHQLFGELVDGQRARGQQLASAAGALVA
jgi:hypothetical protein